SVGRVGRDVLLGEQRETADPLAEHQDEVGLDPVAKRVETWVLRARHRSERIDRVGVPEWLLRLADPLPAKAERGGRGGEADGRDQEAPLVEELVQRDAVPRHVCETGRGEADSEAAELT